MSNNENIGNICVHCNDAIPINNAMLTRALPDGGFEFRHLGCTPNKGPMQFYSVEHDCAEYWVIAASAMRACVLVESQDDFCPDDDRLSARPLGEDDVEGTSFAIESETGSCPMWFAYLIARHGGEQILACSEWS